MTPTRKTLTLAALLLSLASLLPAQLSGQTCTTQSHMQPAERTSLAAAATDLAHKVQANDQAGLQAATIAEYRQDFAAMGGLAAGTSTRLAGATPQVEQLYLLDASTLAPAPGATGIAGANGGVDAQFFCTLNQSQSEADFTIPQLPPGRYAFAIVRMASANPWQLSFLLRQEGAALQKGAWQLAGLYPHALTAGGHDGLWYWTQARAYTAKKQPWNAWLYYQEARNLLQPAGFVSSTHLEALDTELAAAAPPAVAGLSPTSPMVLPGVPAGTEYRITSLSVDDSLGLDLAAHIAPAPGAPPLADPAQARARNLAAMAALLAAHPELRPAFHGVWIFADAPGSPVPYATEAAMPDIR